MVATIVLTQNNIAPAAVNNGNNQFVYQFPSSVAFPNHEIAIQNISMYYSWVNINSTTLNNNTFYYYWNTSGSGVKQFPVVIPDGLYEISTINSYLQFQMIKNGHFWTDSAGNYIYFIEMVVNVNTYTVQINTYPVPATVPSGYTGGSAAATGQGYTPYANPGAAFIPVVSMCNTSGVYNNFYKVVGFTPTFSTYVVGGVYQYAPYVTSSTLNQSVISTVAPQVQPNPTLFLAVSNIDNKYSNPSTIVYQLSPTVAFGELITITPAQFAYNKLLPGTYNGIRLQILGTNLQPINILDPAITITLVIRDRKDVSLVDALGTATGGK